MDIQELIEKIVNDGKVEDMHKLSEILEETLEHLKKCDKDKYKEYELCLYEMAYGKRLTDEMKVEWVKRMKPKAKWELQEIADIHSKYGVEMPMYSLYVVMNMMYSDMNRGIGSGNSPEDIEKYLEISEDWYYDEDAANTEEAKLFAYWKYIVN